MTALAQPVALGDTNAVAANTVSATLGTAPTPGNLLVAVVMFGNTAVTVHPWGAAAHVAAVNTTVARVSIYSKVAAASEPAAVAVTFSASLTTHRLAVYEFSPTSGLAWAGFDGSATAIDAGVTTATLTSGTTPATTTADSVAVAGWSMNGAPGAQVSITNGFTSTLQPTAWSAYKILTATGTQESTLTWTTARRVAAAIATFKQGAPNSSAGFLGIL